MWIGLLYFHFILKRNRFRSTDHYDGKLSRDDRETGNVPPPHPITSNDGELALKRFMFKGYSKLHQVSTLLNCHQTWNKSFI